jgi:hypothetical protein
LAQVFFVFFTCSERLRFDPVGQRFLVGRCLADRPPGCADCPRSTSCSRTVRGRGTDRPRVEVPVGSFCLCLTDSPPWVAGRPRGNRGQSAR